MLKVTIDGHALDARRVEIIGRELSVELASTQALPPRGRVADTGDVARFDLALYYKVEVAPT